MNQPTTETPRRGLPPGERVMRLAAEPRRSVVLAAAGSMANLKALLARLAPLCKAHDSELVVARACSPDEYRELAEAHPDALFMPAPDGCSIRQLRALGLTAADGDVVLLLDDDRPVDEARLASVLEGSRQPG